MNNETVNNETVNHETTQRIGFVAAALTIAAGLAEVIAGSTSWTGDKSEPTTLGLLTIGLGVVMAVAAWAMARRRSTGELLGAATGLAVPALISLTTAGTVAIPGAVVGAVAAASAVLLAAGTGSVRRPLQTAWPTVLLAVLAAIYLAFGAVAGAVGLLGILGAAAIIASLAVARRSVVLATVVLVVGVVPFVIVTWWSVVIPITALLAVAIGVPQLRRLGPTSPDLYDTMPTSV